MSIDMTTINSILLEHIAIQNYIDELRETVAEQAAFLLQSADIWNKSHLKQLRDMHFMIRDSMQALHDGLKRHCAHEEKDLSSVLGKLLAKGNVIEHKEIINYLSQAQLFLNKTKLLGDLIPRELMATTYDVKQTVEIACNLVAKHEASEAGMLELLGKALGKHKK